MARLLQTSFFFLALNLGALQAAEPLSEALGPQDNETERSPTPNALAAQKDQRFLILTTAQHRYKTAQNAAQFVEAYVRLVQLRSGEQGASLATLEARAQSEWKKRATYKEAFLALEKAESMEELIQAHDTIARLGSGREDFLLLDLVHHISQLYESRNWTDSKMSELFWSIPRIIARLPGRAFVEKTIPYTQIIDLVERALLDYSLAADSVMRIRAAQTFAELAVLLPQQEILKGQIPFLKKLIEINDTQYFNSLLEESAQSEVAGRKVLTLQMIDAWMEMANAFVEPKMLLTLAAQKQAEAMLMALMVDMDLEVSQIEENALFERSPDLAEKFIAQLPKSKLNKNQLVRNNYFITATLFPSEAGLAHKWVSSSASMSVELGLLARSEAYRRSWINFLRR